MKHAARILALTVVSLLAFAGLSGVAHATLGTCDTAGPVEIEQPTPTAYPNLGVAFAAINAGTHTGGALDIEICGDTSEGATTATLEASGTGLALYTSISIKPVGGVARTITGGPAGGLPLIDLRGADSVTIDGLNLLTISNTTASATSGTSTIRFINGATGNVVTNASIQGSYSASATTATNLGGNIFFATDASTVNGNDGNTISSCNIGPAGASLPTRGIFSSGSTTTAGHNNSGLVINNNNIFDYFSATVGSAGVDLVTGTTDANVTNNRLYQTVPQTMTTTGLNHSGIRVSNTSGNNSLISGNTIGFASNTGTGTYTLVFPTTTSGSFIPINLSVGTTTATSVQGNTIAGIAISGGASGTSSSAPFRGIYVSSGLTTVGNVTGNTIGSQSATGSISYTSTSTSTSDVMALFNFGSSAWTVNNNLIGGITGANSSTGATNVYGVRYNTSSAVATTVQGNTIGGTVANSLQSTTTATGSQVVGIFASTSASTVTSNTIRNLTAAGGTGTTTAASVVGIAFVSTSVNNTATLNTIHTLSNSNTSAVTILTGIQYTSSTGTNLIARNFIHSFSAGAANTAALVNGIQISGGTATYQNNMVRLGIDAAGAAQTTGYVITAINEIGGTNNIHFNSTYVGGTGVTGSASTFAFNSSVTTNVRAYRDNIFFNARGNAGGGTGKHYAVQVAGTLPNPAGLTINGNVYLTTGTGGVFGRFNSLDVISIAAWQAAVGQDANSFNSNPRYLTPTGTAATVNLHINPAATSVIEGNGIFIASVTDDFDGETRATLTPTDIGADAGLYMGIDLAPPIITYTPLGNSSNTTSRTLSVTVTDPSGVPQAGIGLPVIYFRKGLAGAFSSAQCTYVAGDSYDCVITFATVGGVVGGDQIQYYVAAEDGSAPPNVTSNPQPGASGFTADPPAAATPPTTPSSFFVSAIVTGTKTVCASGCDFTTLTGPTGIFNTINFGEVTGNVSIEIAGDLVVGEDGSVGLNPLNESPPTSNFTVKIYPTGAARLITSTTAPVGGFIRLNASDRVTIDGSLGGTGTDRSLTITDTSTSTTGAVIWIQSNGADGATDNTVKNVNVVGNSNTTTLFGIGSGSTTVSTTSLGTGNHNLTIQNNSIRRTQYGIYAQGASAANKNTGTVITQNLINAAAPNNVLRGGIHVGFANGPQITENKIEGMAMATPSSGDTFGIAVGLPGIGTGTFTGNEVTNASVSRNLIGRVSNTTTFSSAGISLASATSGTSQISNNSIYAIGANGTAGDFGVGIFVGGGVGSTTQVYYNSVSLSGTFTSTSTTPGPNYALAIGSGDPTVDVKNNALHNVAVYTGTSPNVGQVYAIGTASTTFVNLTSNYNDLFTSTGTGYFIGRSGSLAVGAGTNYLALGDWTAATGDDTPNSISVDPAFNSTTNLQPLPGSPLVGAGTVISVTIDITGGGRSGTTPTIGAYETAADASGPVIAYTALGNTLSLSNRILSITVTDAFSTVPTAGSGLPVIYFRKGTSGAYASTQCTHTGGSGYDCTIDYSMVTGGSVAAGDTVQYYVAAQDSANNVSTNPSVGADALTANPPAAGTPPTPNAYLISTAISGTYNVGTGETFTSLTNPGGIFEYINNNVLTGNTTVEITSDLTGETGVVALNQWAEDGVGNYTLLIKPSVLPTTSLRTVSGPSTGTNSGMIVLNGADRVTIDGSQSGGTDQNLILSNTNIAGVVVWIRSASTTNGANNNTVKNCRLNGSTGTTTIAGILAGGTTFGGAADAPNSNNSIRNNVMTKVQNAAFISGNAAGLDQNWLVTENTFGSTVLADKLGFRGILIGGAQNFVISKNTINGVISLSSSTATMSGIQVSANILNGTISGNRISDIKQTNTAGWGSNGILLGAATTASNLTVSNNFIWDVASQGFAGVAIADNGYGIALATGGGYKIYHNSVNLNTNQVAVGSITAAINVTSGITTAGSVDLRDNIFSNVETIGTRYGIYSAAPATVYSNINHNDYFATNVGFLGVAKPTLLDWQGATLQDANSIAADPIFVSATDLHINFAGATPVENAGTPIATVTDDIDGDPRNLLAPEIGADEELDLVCFAAICMPSNTDCGIASCDPGGLAGNCDIVTPRTVGFVCRAVNGTCDVAETCDGTNNGACPTDDFVAANVECRAIDGDCDVAEVCTGTSGACPTDAFLPSTTECNASSGPACDPAEFCTGSAGACPADVINPNDEVAAIGVDKTGSDADISWTEVEPGPFNVYRGSTRSGRPWVYNQGCLVQDAAGPSETDTDTPPAHVAFYYLVSRVQPPCDESSLGQDYDFQTMVSNDIPNNNPCPSSGDDTDGDGVLDYLDNCPADPNAGQEDVDGDAHGDLCDKSPVDFNPGQEDADNDGFGDVKDNCIVDFNPLQEDADLDGLGDLCDNCPADFNPGQEDSDQDGLGDVCDP